MPAGVVLNEMARSSTVIYGELTGSAESFLLRYLPNPRELCGIGDEEGGDVGEVIRARLAANVEREIGQGATVVGPHRDDVQFEVGGRDASLYGSRGQQRTVVAALKLAEVQLLEGNTEEGPILLLDDILSELDETRRRRVLETVLRELSRRY